MFKLIDLPYKSLAPVISDETLSFHHGKHLQTYVDNLNKLIAGTEFETMSLEEIVKKSSGAVFNHAGQILNHNLYFGQFCEYGTNKLREGMGFTSPEGALLAQIVKQWGGVDSFKSDFGAKGVGLFGSGWVWLQADASGALSIAQYPNADNPVAHGLRPILTFDVWEHAYYLDYQNKRAAHLSALWGIVNWKEIEKRYI